MTNRSNRSEISRPGCFTGRMINHGPVVNATESWYRDPPMGRREAALTMLLLLLVGCTTTSPAQVTPSAQPSIQIANFERYVGAYRTAGSVTYVVNGHGHLLNLQDSTFRQLYPTSVPDRFTVGRAFAIPSPKEADVIFRMAGARADQLTIDALTKPAVVAQRLLFKETEVQVPATDAV